MNDYAQNPPAPMVSVVIPVINGVDTLKEQLDAVLNQQLADDFEIVVVDNGSTDGTQSLVRSVVLQDPRVRLIDGSSCRRGGAAAKNLGVVYSRAEKIAFCDADDVVEPGWLSAVVDGLDQAPVVSVATDYERLNRVHQMPANAAERVPVYFHGYMSLGGGAFGMRRTEYLKVGMFDESMSGAVDTEFSLRVGKLGYRPLYLAGAVVSVRVPTSSRQAYRRAKALKRSVPFIEIRHGLASARWKVCLVALVRLAVSAPSLLSRRGRYRWFKRAGGFVGLAQGLWRTRGGRTSIGVQRS